MSGMADRVEMVSCPTCKKEVSSQAAACPSCGHPIAAKRPGEGMGIAMLLLPVAGAALLWLWVANMNMLQQPADTAMGIIVAVVVLTAILAAAEASQLGISGVTWFVGCVLLWVVAFPMYLYERSKHGLKNMVVGGMLVTAIFAGSGWLLISAIEEKKAEIRQKLEAIPGWMRPHE